MLALYCGDMGMHLCICCLKKGVDVYVCVHVYLPYVCGHPECQKRVSDPVELQLQASVSRLMWVLGATVQPSGRAIGTQPLSPLLHPHTLGVKTELRRLKCC